MLHLPPHTGSNAGGCPAALELHLSGLSPSDRGGRLHLAVPGLTHRGWRQNDIIPFLTHTKKKKKKTQQQKHTITFPAWL